MLFSGSDFNSEEDILQMGKFDLRIHLTHCRRELSGKSLL